MSEDGPLQDLVERVALALYARALDVQGDCFSEELWNHPGGERAYWRRSAQEAIAVVRQWDAGK